MGTRQAVHAGRIAALALASFGVAAEEAKGQELSDGSGRFRAATAAFVENAGQWAGPARFHARAGGQELWIGDDGFVVVGVERSAEARRGCAVAFTLEGAQSAVARGESPIAGASTFIAADGSAQRAERFERVRLRDVRPGVDLVLQRRDESFAYDLELAPGVELAEVVVRVDGALGLALEPDGRLRVDTAIGALHQSPPVSWALARDGAARPVASRFELRGAQHYAFVAEERAHDERLVVDPGVLWGSYLGGSDQDVVRAVAIAPNGEIVLAGVTASFEFPATRGAYDLSLAGANDAVVARVSADGSELLAATYLGGSASEDVTALALGPVGEIGIAGETRSADFPVTPGAHDTSHNGGADVFVAILSADAASLLRASFLGHVGDERAQGLTLGAGLQATICGGTNSTSFPTTFGAYDTSYNGGVFGGGDAFVARFGPNLSSLAFASFLGGAHNETALDLAVGPGGEMTVAGVTGSVNFPTTAGAFDPTSNGGGTTSDGFVTRFNAAGSALAWSTFLGGSLDDELRALALFADGSVALAGMTSSTNLPISAGAGQTSAGGGGDAFVASLSPNGASLAHATYLGGDDLDRAYDVKAEPGGTLVACGATRSGNFPSSPWAYDSAFNGVVGNFESDAFVARVAADGAHEYVSYLGGSHDDEALGMWLAADGTLLVCGHTNSASLPTPGGFDPIYDNSLVPDGFVLRFELLRHPFAYGSAKLNSMGWMPTIGGDFASHAIGSHAIYMDLGVPQKPGWLFRGDGAAQLPFHGGHLWVAPPFTRIAPIQTDVFGGAAVSIPISAAMVGTTRWYQFWQVDPGDAHGIGLTAGFEVLYYP